MLIPFVVIVSVVVLYFFCTWFSLVCSFSSPSWRCGGRASPSVEGGCSAWVGSDFGVSLRSFGSDFGGYISFGSVSLWIPSSVIEWPLGSSPTGVNAESFEFEFLVDRSHRNETSSRRSGATPSSTELLSLLIFGTQLIPSPTGSYPWFPKGFGLDSSYQW